MYVYPHNKTMGDVQTLWKDLYITYSDHQKNASTPLKL